MNAATEKGRRDILAAAHLVGLKMAQSVPLRCWIIMKVS